MQPVNETRLQTSSRQTVYYQQKVSETPQPLKMLINEDPTSEKLPHKFNQTEMAGITKKS
jgi:hypothetical protein